MTSPLSLTLSLNGESCTFTPVAGSPPSLAALLGSLASPLPARGVAVAVNGALVPRQHWPHHPLNAGDVVEIVKALQGG